MADDMRKSPSAGMRKSPSEGMLKPPSAGMRKSPSASMRKSPSVGTMKAGAEDGDGALTTTSTATTATTATATATTATPTLSRTTSATKGPPSRLSLRLSAAWWRSLQCVAMTLHFYVPADYKDKDKSGSETTTYPAVVNFHGGGFVLGSATDDARFARCVTAAAGAVFVSVDYRLAPEHPFPTAVEDSTDALLHLVRHAARLRLDPQRLATSGFSAGGNLCLTSLLRLGTYLEEEAAGAAEAAEAEAEVGAAGAAGSAGATTEETAKGTAKATARATAKEKEPLPPHRFVAAAAWYPTVDMLRTRAERRAECRRPERALPPILTDLFDAAYLYPADRLDLRDPYLSPAQASDARLARDLPPTVLLYTCEWDMLLGEGEALAARLAAPPIAKDVHYTMVPAVVHGWDKGPNPLRPPQGAEALYRACCDRLKAVFDKALAEGQTTNGQTEPLR